MVVNVKLKHIDELAGGRKPFRGRWPKDVGVARGEDFMQRPLKARLGASFRVGVRGGSVDLNRFRAFSKWFSASVMPLPHRASAG